MTVLVLTEDLDPTVDRVLDDLNQRGVPVLRCDTSWFPARLELGAELSGPDWTGALRTPDRSVELTDLRSVWCRRPTGFTFPSGMSEPERRHAQREATLGLGGVLSALRVLWMNHPARDADATYKPWQLATAVRCGLPVPRTLVTNDPAAVRRFAVACGGRIVVKVLGANILFEDLGATMSHTRLLTDDDLSDLSGVEVTAHLFQEWVVKAHEVRLTAVGDRLFATAIHAGSDAARIDWRADYDALSYGVCDVPREVAAGVRAYLTAFGLTFGAFDFAVTPDGRWQFLECNPGGQWGWIEAATGLPISLAVADLLEKGI